MSPIPPNLDEQRRKVEAANARLIRHERLSRIALLLIVLLCVSLLALLIPHIWEISRLRGLQTHSLPGVMQNPPLNPLLRVV